MDPGFSCAGQSTAQFITNPTAQLKCTWFDTGAVPSTIATTGLAENTTNDSLETEALAAAQHFGYNINATYLILTEPGIVATGYGTVYCGYHSETHHTTGHGVRYTFIPVCARTGCGVRDRHSQQGRPARTVTSAPGPASRTSASAAPTSPYSRCGATRPTVAREPARSSADELTATPRAAGA